MFLRGEELCCTTSRTARASMRSSWTPAVGMVERPAFRRDTWVMGVTDDGEVEEPPSERIAAYVAAPLERWRDLTEDDEKTSPWSSGPLIGNTSGPVIYFGMSWSMAEEAST
ncbi:hypothetical protein OG562_41850 [Streptomyces sp. NBC_01275]|uniref:hypothetical protein n=1 Tax=Streptomyces sp. NBC_01275 TaxID=2903807 RepID=UPI0022511E8A|nr:hypothetical protein [Streptomyces sp. NBC_01275]MCX4767391.1 hypothetical protein [Streptomyces sp. NBC_01275]